MNPDEGPYPQRQARLPMTAPQRRRSESAPRLRKGERRRQLLSHAKQLFVTLGYHATTTEKIATAAGVSEPVLYRHFDSKKALFLEVLAEVRAATIERWKSETANLTDPMAKLHAISELYLDTTLEHALEFGVMHRALLETGDEEVLAMIRGFYLESEELLANVIAEGQQTGVFRRPLDPRVGAWELIRTALGYTLTLRLGLPLYSEPDYLSKAIECMLHCLLKTDV
jgi:AcrR family transcriptional regulator